MMNRSFYTLLGCLLAAFSLPAQAYLGPGAGLSAIGSAIALLAAILIAIVGFLWFPLKRMMARKKQQDVVEDDLDDLPETRNNNSR